MSRSGVDEVKQRIRQLVDIVKLIGEQIPLRPQGRGFVGLCPWHNDTRPSLQVDPERQTWKCWVCDVGGDCYDFVMRREGMTFPEAKRLLAERTGVPLTRTVPSRQAVPGSAEDKNTLLQAMAWAVEQFHRFLLQSPQAAAGSSLLAAAPVEQASIDRFRIGFAPLDWDWLLRQAEGTAFSREVLEAVGLAAISERTGRYYDVFRGRLLFPISDPQRRPIALGGRRLDELVEEPEKSAKYINTRETRLFSKSEQLYGLDLAKDAIQKGRHALLMEGYTDVVIARQLGLENVVAILGTALVAGHIQLIRRFADRVTLVLDGDDAGRKRANDVLEIFLAHQMDLRIITLPDGLDPCDFLLTHGADAMQVLVKDAPDALQHRIQIETQGLDFVKDTHQTHRALEKLLSTLATCPAPSVESSSERLIWEQQILNRLSRQFQLNEEQLRRRLRELRHQKRASAPPTAQQHKPDRAGLQLDATERELFELILQVPEAVPRMLEAISQQQLTSPAGRALYQGLSELVAAGRRPELHELMHVLDNPEMNNLLVDLDLAGQAKSGSDADLALQDLLRTFARHEIEAEVQRCRRALDAGDQDEQQQLELVQKIVKLRQQLEQP